MSANPYAAPAVEAEAVPEIGAGSDTVAIRRAHLSHEASLRGVGSLWVLGGGMTLLTAAWLIGGPFLRETADGAAGMVVVVFFSLMGLASLWCGLDLRRLKPRARIGGTILAALSLLWIPMGTLLGFYALYLLHAKKGRVVLGPDYARIIELTPQVKRKTSVIVWIALGLLGALFLVVTLSSFGPSR